MRHTTGGQGGAVDVGGPVALHMSNCSFSENAAMGAGGGALFVGQAAGPVAVYNCTFQENVAKLAAVEVGSVSGMGGALFLSHSSHVVVTGSSLSENAAVHGGAICVSMCALSRLEQLNLVNNSAILSGGAIMLVGMPPNSTLSEDVRVVALLAETSFDGNYAGDLTATFSPTSVTSVPASLAGLLASRRRRMQDTNATNVSLLPPEASTTGGTAPKTGSGGSLQVQGGVAVLAAGLQIQNSLARVGAAIAVDDRCTANATAWQLSAGVSDPALRVAGATGNLAQALVGRTA